ncbi:hypothetical protein [Carnimonas nigrificans]|uniref:hypothetical protein n=1 Tax=Carnimonas nigrificans TaxID=64323 RepID=UPI000684D66A|nr:hypothetical protein [Carnimonas nigrificans]
MQSRAGRLAILQREKYLGEYRSFAVETTLSGNASIRLMEKARSLGYRISLIYIGLDSAMVSFIRVQTRVRDGGHSVPDQLLPGRYNSSMNNLAAAIDLADRCWILDNSSRQKRFVMRRVQNKTTIMASPLPNWAIKWIPAEFL